MKINLIRHFKTKGNLEGRYIGRTDETIVRPEAEKMGVRNILRPEKIVSSPMKRCIQSSEFLYGRIPDVICEDFREKDFGEYEGKNFEELKDEPAYKKWLDSGGSLPFPAGEDQENFIRRNREAFEHTVDLLISERAKSAAFVIHGGSIMAILSGFSEAKSGFYDWQAENGNGYQMVLKEEDWKSGRKKLTEIEKLW